MNIEKELRQIIKSDLKKDEPMAKHTSWLVGGPADYYVCPANLEELVAVVTFCHQEGFPLYVLGNGTNLLVLDGGIRGMVLNINKNFSYIKPTETGLTAGAGTAMSYLATKSARLNLTGLEFAVGIPGTLGGAVIMNAGAFGGYIGEKVHSVKMVSTSGQIISLEKDKLSFAYRDSNLAGRGVIFEVALVLKKGDTKESIERMTGFLEERNRRHPNLPSAGSVFRNLPDLPAGKLIESAGGKGMKVGGAEVSTKHANFIVNTGGATAADILTLINSVRNLVKQKHGLDLKPEVKIVGEES